MYCANCGYEINIEEAKYCIKCGRKIDDFAISDISAPSTSINPINRKDNPVTISSFKTAKKPGFFLVILGSIFILISFITFSTNMVAREMMGLGIFTILIGFALAIWKRQ